MKEILTRLTNGEKLSREEAKATLFKITEGIYSDIEISSFLTVYMMRDITAEELGGFRDALLEKAVKPNLDGSNAIDLCGTGGDGKDTFNISTLTSFVVAGAGYKVIKHGNASVSSACGSSDVLAAVGYKLTNDEDILQRQLDAANFCYLHAPLFHPAMASVGPVRKTLKLKTFFNMIGPLVNPVQPAYQMVGVFSPFVGELYKDILRECREGYGIVYSDDGYDEISLTDSYNIVNDKSNQEFGASFGEVTKTKPEELFGGAGIEDAKKILLDILSGKGTRAQSEVVIINAAHAIQIINSELSFIEAFEQAENSLLEGKALDVLNRVKEIQ